MGNAGGTEDRSIGAVEGTSAAAAQLGPIEVTTRDRETVNIPVWLGVGAVVAGGVILVLSRKR